MRTAADKGQGKAMTHPTTLLEIFFDVDGYLEDGGKLLDLEPIPPQQTQDRIEIAAERGSIPAEILNRIQRIGRFCKVGPENAGAASLSEDALRRIWRETP